MSRATANIVLSFVDVYRRWGSSFRRSGPRRRERLRRDAHERRPWGDRRNRQTLIHARPQQRHAQRVSGSGAKARALERSPFPSKQEMISLIRTAAAAPQRWVDLLYQHRVVKEAPTLPH
jgi:hypothetical protein